MENNLRDINIAITAASYSGNKGAAAMLQSSISQLHDRYGSSLNISLMSVYPEEDRLQNPHDFVKVIPATPAKVVFLEFPLALLYFIFRWIPGLKRLFMKNKMLKVYKETDLVIDEAGISFVDSRGFVMNTYAFITMAIPKLMGAHVVKYSQALGTFDKFINRLYAKMILPKLDLICARGQLSAINLENIEITSNVRVCADGAFTMPDDVKIRDRVASDIEKDPFFTAEGKGIVAVSISSVVDKKCRKSGVDYRKKTVEFIDYLNENGYSVLLIANAARINSKKLRNNDLPIGDAIYSSVKNTDKVCWYHREMDAEEIREYIGRCRFVVASRFHAMIGALQRKIPVLLVGWSHKYREVLEMFGLEDYCIDYKLLKDGAGENESGNFESFEAVFLKLEKDEADILQKIEKNYNKVMSSSRDNIRFISETLDGIIAGKKTSRKLLDFENPTRYLGYDVLYCRKGYAADAEIRKNAASGGVVTALLVSLLKQKRIDGALVCKTEITDRKLSYRCFIATTPEELMDCSSSVYLYMPLLKELDRIRSFNGRVAVVLTPCLMTGLNAILENDRELRDKIVLKLGLFCSGNQTEEPTLYSLDKCGIELDRAKRLYYRRGLWRGQSSMVYEDGSTRTFSYTKSVCAYKNAYYFEKPQCMICQDQFCNGADISFGDIWLKEMKKENIKHTGYIIRTENGQKMYEAAVSDGAIIDSHMSINQCIKGQKRALVFKYNCAAAKFKYYAARGKNVKLDTMSKCRWNHSLAFKLAEKNRLYSEQHPDKLKKKPMFIIYYRMCFIRLLLSF